MTPASSSYVSIRSAHRPKCGRDQVTRVLATSLILVVLSGTVRPVRADVSNAIAQPVYKQSVVYNEFVKTLEDPGFTLSPQLDAINSALSSKDPQNAYSMNASLEQRLGDSAFLYIGQIMPELVPKQGEPPRQSMEFRTVKRINVEQSMELALRQNLQIGIAGQSLNVAKWNYTGALGAFAPNITLDLQAGGSRKFTNGFPHIPLNSNSGQAFANFSYSLFQGGKVLFSAINTHEVFLQQKGLFAAQRNDTLNNTITAYYNVLSNQAILNVRLDSAQYCAKQLLAYRRLFGQQLERSIWGLNEAVTRSSDLVDTYSGMAIASGDLVQLIPAVDKLVLVPSTTSPLARELHNRSDYLQRSAAKSSSVLQHLKATSIWLDSALRFGMSNEQYRQLNLTSASTQSDNPDHLPATEQLDSKNAVISYRTRLRLLVTMFNNWRDTIFDGANGALLQAERMLGRHAMTALDNDAGIDVPQAKTYVHSALDDIHKVQRDLEPDLSSALAALPIMLSNIAASLPSRALTDEQKKPILARIKDLDNSKPSLQQDKIQQIACMNLLVAKTLRRASILPRISNESRQTILDALDKVNQSYMDWQMAFADYARFCTANSANLQKSQDSVDFLASLLTELQSLSNQAAAESQFDDNLVQQVNQWCDDLLPIVHRMNPRSRAQALTAIDNLRASVQGLPQDADLGVNLFQQTTVYVTRAKDIENAEAGYAFQLEQWSAQLASDVQDAINQYITLRGSSIALAVLLNIDPRTDLISSQTYLSCQAHDLSPLEFPELVRETLNNRPELFATDEFRRAALANVVTASSQLMPTFSIFAQITGAGANHNIENVHFAKSTTFGCEATYKFTNLLLPSAANVAAQGATAIQAYLKFRDQLNNVLASVHTSYIGVQTAKLQVAVALKNAQKATQQLVVADTPSKRLKVSASNLDVINALKQRNTAMVTLAASLATYNTAQAQLLHDTGQIYPISNFIGNYASP